MPGYYYQIAITLVLEMVRDTCSVDWFALLACLKFMDKVILAQEQLFFSFFTVQMTGLIRGRRVFQGFKLTE